MPYIPSNLRQLLEPAIDSLATRIIANCARGGGMAGQINFAISRLIVILMHEYGLKYALINELVGALECCKLELYRRLAANYEDRKIKENGDVFPG